MEIYARHMNLLGEENFAKIHKASVMVAGAGGLGSSVLNLLARLGIGTIYFYEFAEIDPPDLNRQILYNSEDIGNTKCDIAIAGLRKINPNINIIAHCEKINKKTKIPKVDLVFDCLDNFTSRYILDDLIFPKGIPMVHAGVSTYFGQLTVIIPGKTECLRKIISVDATKFDEKINKEIFPPVVTTMASLQVSEGVKYLTGDFSNLLFGKILVIDLLSNSFDTINIK
ncbi:MAG: HesA/MoeB/ThiF family protein [Bacteroidales bacterium]|nr:HesA/MoeB/ThiF family protein [Bacteroidales bacterium]